MSIKRGLELSLAHGPLAVFGSTPSPQYTLSQLAEGGGGGGGAKYHEGAIATYIASVHSARKIKLQQGVPVIFHSHS
jgi:hypothetical protein